MNLLAMMTLAILVPSADTEKDDVWVRVTSNHVEILASPEHADAVRTKSPEGILVKCKTLKINFTAGGKVIECENCIFYTSTGMNGTAHSAVFDQIKGILTLTGDETTPVEWTTSNENGEQKIVSQSMQITLLRSESKPIHRGDPVYFGESRRLDPIVDQRRDNPDPKVRRRNPSDDSLEPGELGLPVDTLIPERKNN